LAHSCPFTHDLRRNGLDGQEADRLRFGLPEASVLSVGERGMAMLLLDEDCGIRLWRPLGERRRACQDGRRRACALMDAGIRRILVAVTGDRRFPG
jgi:hypothetical protein